MLDYVVNVYSFLCYEICNWFPNFQAKYLAIVDELVEKIYSKFLINCSFICAIDFFSVK